VNVISAVPAVIEGAGEGVLRTTLERNGPCSIRRPTAIGATGQTSPAPPSRTTSDANKAWLATVGWAADLVAWFQLLCLTGPLAGAEPKTLRWRLWHTPARVIRKSRRHVTRLLDGWPDTNTILTAYQRIAALT